MQSLLLLCVTCSFSGELMRAGIVEDSGRKCRGEIWWWYKMERETKEQKEREETEMLLDRLLLIRGCLAPHHYVMRNPFSFAWNFSYLVWPPLSDLEIRLAYDYSMAPLANIPPPHPPHVANASGLELSWPFVNLGPPTMHTTTAALWNNSVMAHPQRSHANRFAHAAHKHVSLSVTKRASQVIAFLEE